MVPAYEDAKSRVAETEAEVAASAARARGTKDVECMLFLLCGDVKGICCGKGW